MKSLKEQLKEAISRRNNWEKYSEGYAALSWEINDLRLRIKRNEKRKARRP